MPTAGSGRKLRNEIHAGEFASLWSCLSRAIATGPRASRTFIVSTTSALTGSRPRSRSSIAWRFGSTERRLWVVWWDASSKRSVDRVVVADLTDERPSCYFEVGYAEALGKHVVFLASRESVINPGDDTRIHFDIHQNVQFFTNHDELAEKLRAVLEANRSELLDQSDPTSVHTGVLANMLEILSAAPTHD